MMDYKRKEEKNTRKQTHKNKKNVYFSAPQRIEENIILKRILYMGLESTRPRGRPRNRWQHDLSKDGKIVGGEEWQEKVYNREEWKKLLRMARNCCILHMSMECMNG
jgi:hypothetical protein